MAFSCRLGRNYFLIKNHCGREGAPALRSKTAPPGRRAPGAALPRLLLAAALLCAPAASVTGSNIWTTIDVSDHKTLLTYKLNQNSTQIQGHRWLKGDKVLQEDSSSSPETRYEVMSHDKTGEYQCVFLPAVVGKADVQVKGPPKIVASKKSEHGNEGDTIVLTCKSTSYPPVDHWIWSKLSEPGSYRKILNGSEGRIIIIETPEKTELHVQAADLKKDHGKYMCNGTNSEGSDSAVITLKVRCHLAALWPFLGIVAEVLILFTVIFICEKKRNPGEIPEAELPGDEEWWVYPTEKQLLSK